MHFFYHFGRYLIMLRGGFTVPDKFAMYWKEVMRQMSEIGVGSMPIVSVMAVFIGGVTAIQFAHQISNQASLIPIWYIGIIVRDSMILELAPTLTGLLIAGKVGSNIASELGNMRINEQIDALKIMGVNTSGYLVGPKVFACFIALPLLLVFAVALGILGGLFAGVASGIYGESEYVRGLQDPMEDLNLITMFMKGGTFGFIVGSVSCYQGFFATGGAVGVGKASTRAVVYSSILLIIANYIIASAFLS